MFWIILGVIVTVFIIIWIWKEDLWVGIDFCIAGTLGTVVMAAFVIFIVTFIASGCISSNPNNIVYEKNSDEQIYALKDNLNLNGNLYIVSGYVGEELYYYYAVETEFGYNVEKINAKNAFIKYTNENPHIETYKSSFAKDGLYFWGYCIAQDKYVIYCPEGTVTNQFNIDLE